ncbi:MAG: AAA family ATPase [Candidatus Obscuribacterales bacterium]|nr:AAA family ATPase [Candidatus Obscuribacterales bacterium]
MPSKHIISIANQKGGVAKTTTTAYLGAALSRLHRKVLLIDSDPQANLTYSLELNDEQKEHAQDNSLATIYESGGSLADCILPIRDNLHLVPASPDLVMTEVALDTSPETLSGKPECILSDALKPVAANYDYILIDCPPSQGMLTLNALCASNWIVIPTMASVISLTGLERMLEQVHEIVHGEPSLNEDLKILGVLITRFRKDRTVEVELEQRLRTLEEDFAVFRTVIPDRSQFELMGELQAHTGRHLVDLSMVSYSLLPYLTLAMELEKMLSQKQPAKKGV